MYDNNSDAHRRPSTLPMYPPSPDADDPRWREVAVRSRSQSQTGIRRFPTDVQDLVITTVYAGDTIAIMPEVQYDYYVAARVGYHVGWINFKHVKLVSLHSRSRRYLEETKPNQPVHTNQEQYEARAAQRQARIQQRIQEAACRQTEYREEETQPAPAQQVERQAPPVARKDIHRIIDKLKSLGGLLSRR